jgi:hypothetical protein
MDISDGGRKEGLARIAVTSQEDSALWLGQINLTTFEIEDEGTVLHFPRSDDGCEAMYCNIEGVQFIDEYVPTLLFVLLRPHHLQGWTYS